MGHAQIVSEPRANREWDMLQSWDHSMILESGESFRKMQPCENFIKKLIRKMFIKRSKSNESFQKLESSRFSRMKNENSKIPLYNS